MYICFTQVCVYGIAYFPFHSVFHSVPFSVPRFSNTHKSNEHTRKLVLRLVKFNCKPSSNIWQDIPNHFISFWIETRKRHQSKCSASKSLAETINKPAAEFDNIIIIIWLSLNQLCHVYVQLIFFIKNTRSDTQTYSYIIFIIISISIYVSDKTVCCNEVRVFYRVSFDKLDLNWF